MAYATAQEFSARYASKLTDAEITSHFLAFASSRLDSMLAPYFSVPFSSNNLSAKDLTIDLSHLLILQRSKEPKDYQALREQVEERIGALAEGTQSMITNSGEAIFARSATGDVWSNTSATSPVFHLGWLRWYCYCPMWPSATTATRQKKCGGGDFTATCL